MHMSHINLDIISMWCFIADLEGLCFRWKSLQELEEEHGITPNRITHLISSVHRHIQIEWIQNVYIWEFKYKLELIHVNSEQGSQHRNHNICGYNLL